MSNNWDKDIEEWKKRKAKRDAFIKKLNLKRLSQEAEASVDGPTLSGPKSFEDFKNMIKDIEKDYDGNIEELFDEYDSDLKRKYEELKNNPKGEDLNEK